MVDIAKIKDEISDEQFERLMTRAEWGSLNFQEIRPELSLLRLIQRQSDTVDPRFLNETLKKVLQDSKRDIAQIFKQLGQFSIDADRPKERRNQIIEHARSVLQQQLSGPASVLTTLNGLGGNNEYSTQLAEMREKIQKDALDLSELIQNTRAQLEGSVKAAEEAAVKAKESAARTGVTVHEVDFSQEVTELDKSRRIWLALAFCFTCTAIATAISMTSSLSGDASAIAIGQHLVTKVFVVGAQVSAAVWCASIYRALSHQRAVNKHRMNALRTFKTFVSAAESSEVRQAILLETTRTIFGSAPTGYINASESNVDAGSKMADALTKISKPSTGGG